MVVGCLRQSWPANRAIDWLDVGCAPIEVTLLRGSHSAVHALRGWRLINVSKMACP